MTSLPSKGLVMLDQKITYLMKNKSYTREELIASGVMTRHKFSRMFNAIECGHPAGVCHQPKLLNGKEEKELSSIIEKTHESQH